MKPRRWSNRRGSASTMRAGFWRKCNLLGIQALGLGLATYVHEISVRPRIVVGHDFRGYSLSVKQALIIGLLEGGMEVLDVGLALSPAAISASSNWTPPASPWSRPAITSWLDRGEDGGEQTLTFGPDEMGRLKKSCWAVRACPATAAGWCASTTSAETYIADVASKVQVKRPLKVVCACGNGTAGAFAPGPCAHGRRGDRDGHRPRLPYNPNPEDHAMLVQMAQRVKETGADLALGFDGDGDPLRRGGRHGRRNLRRQDRPDAGPRPVQGPPRLDLRRRCEVDWPLQDRRGS